MTVVAIDGPSGAGKSTLARRAAAELGFRYIDTGAYYRAIALYALENGIDPTKLDIVPHLKDLSISTKYIDGEQRIFLQSRDVSTLIRSPEVSQATSQVSALPPVRDWLLTEFQRLGEQENVIMDGRDIGTVVFPNAKVKIFLTATPEERGRRRHSEYVAKGQQIEYNQVLADILIRDQQDSSRKTAPLKQAEDAVLLDSTDLDYEESLAAILKIIKKEL